MGMHVCCFNRFNHRKTALLAQVRMRLWRAVTSTERILGSQDQGDECGGCHKIDGELVGFRPEATVARPLLSPKDQMH